MIKQAFLVVLLAVIVAIVADVYVEHPFTAISPINVKQVNFKEEDIPDLAGKVILVTGANTGLGYFTSLHLASRGAEVILGCRSAEKCNEAAERIKSDSPGAKVAPALVDLGNLASVQKFSDSLLEKYDRLDSVILNAGIMTTPYRLTDNKFESQYGVNVVGHTYMMLKLKNLVVKTAEKQGVASIVFVSSAAHHFAKEMFLDEAKLNDEATYNRGEAYNRSKLGNVLCANFLAKQLASSNVVVNSVHPGFVDTELGRYVTEDVIKFLTSIPVLGEHLPIRTITESFALAISKVAWSPKQASLTSVYASVSPNVIDTGVTGKYFIPIAMEQQAQKLALDTDLQEKHWEFVLSLLQDRGFTDFQ